MGVWCKYSDTPTTLQQLMWCHTLATPEPDTLRAVQGVFFLEVRRSRRRQKISEGVEPRWVGRYEGPQVFRCSELQKRSFYFVYPIAGWRGLVDLPVR